MAETLPSWIDPRSVTVEARWLPLPGHEHRLAVLERELEARGTSWHLTAGVVAWLQRKADGRPDPTTGPTRTRYRKMLAELADVDPDDDGGLGAELDDDGFAGGSPVLAVPAAEADRALRLLEEAGVPARRIDIMALVGDDADELPEAA